MHVGQQARRREQTPWQSMMLTWGPLHLRRGMRILAAAAEVSWAALRRPARGGYLNRSPDVLAAGVDVFAFSRPYRYSLTDSRGCFHAVPATKLAHQPRSGELKVSRCRAEGFGEAAAYQTQTQSG